MVKNIMRVAQISISIVLLVVFSANLTFAQNRPHNVKGAIAEKLQSDDAVQFNEGFVAAQKMVAAHKPDVHFVESMDEWLQILIAKQKYDALDQLIISIIQARSNDLSAIERYEAFEVQLYLAAGRPQDALASAKSLYNVCSMASTSNAVDAVCNCLAALHPKEEADKMIQQFRLQQIMCATSIGQSDAPDQHPQASATSGDSLLSQIKCSTAFYDTGLFALELNGKGPDRLIAKGNLLLLSDRPQDAERVFRLAYSLTSKADPQPAIDGIARSMRAQDGNVARANKWILSCSGGVAIK